MVEERTEALITKIILLGAGLVILYLIAKYFIEKVTAPFGPPPSTTTYQEQIKAWSDDYRDELERFLETSKDGKLTEDQIKVLQKKEDIIHSYIEELKKNDKNYESALNSILITIGIIAISAAVIRSTPAIVKAITNYHIKTAQVKKNRPLNDEVTSRLANRIPNRIIGALPKFAKTVVSKIRKLVPRIIKFEV